MSRRRKIVLTITLTLVTGLLFTTFILPSIVRNQLEKQVGSATDRKCTVAGVSLNPLNWSAEVRGVKLSEKSGNVAFVSFSSLKFRVSPTSIWRFAPVISELTLASPYVHLRRDAPNSYNFSDILAKQPKQENTKPARFSLNNIVITNGRVEFDDAALTAPQKHEIARLTLQIPFISNIPYFADKYVAPKLSGLVNGAPLAFTGRLKPFEKGFEAAMEINLKGIDIPFYAAYFPEKLPVKVAGGKLATALQISHKLVQGVKPDINISGMIAITGLVLAEHSGAPLLSLKSLNVGITRLGLLQKQYDIAGISLENPQLSVNRDKAGILNLARLTLKENKPAAAQTAENAGPEKPVTAPDLRLASLQVIDGAVSFSDAVPPGGSSAEFRKINLQLNNFTLNGELPAPYTLALVTGRNETASAAGSISLAPLALSARLALSDIVLAASYPYLAALLTEPIRGKADFSGDLAYSGAKGLTVDRITLRLKEIKAPFGKNDGATLPLVVAEGGSVNLLGKTAAFARVAATGGTVQLSRSPDGRLSTALLLRQEAAAQSKAAPAGKTSRPFSWKIGTAAVRGLKLIFTDELKEEKPQYVVNRINASIANISGPLFTEMPLSFTADYGDKGNLSLAGKLQPAPFLFKGDIALKSFPFVDFDSYLPEGVNIDLLDGKLDANLAVNLLQQNGKLTGGFSGNGNIRDFYSVDAENEEDLLKWESLGVEGLSGSLAPFSLAINGISLNNYYARVIVSKNGRLNLQDLYKPAASGEHGAAGQSGDQQAPQQKSVRIDTVSLTGGTLNFSDHHLNRDFNTTMLNLGGRISGLSSAEGSAADVDLRGNLENHSPLKISGRLNPLAKELFLNMEIAFSEIELSPLTPYSGTYLGYAIDKGKLSLALKYKIDHQQLTAENRVFLDQFTFGEKIESGKATSLPVRLAVALLKDKNGEIHLDLPLSGRTDSPKFSIWGLVGQVLQNLLVKAATSPLALLQASFGGGADFSGVTFPSGVSRLSAAEEAKLQALAKALTERPGIRLEVTGFADRERDQEGFRSELLLKKMKNEKFLSLVKEKRESGVLSHDAVTIPPDEQTRWLKAVYEKEKFPRPRTAIGTLKALPDDEMKKLILANTTVSEEQLRGLARERTVMVMNFLLNEGHLSQDRLFEKSADPFAAPTKDAKAGGRVEFGVVVK